MIKAKKSLGQNFLNDRGTLAKIVAAANIKPTDTVIEIGPGHGILTQELAARAKKVIALELDQRLIPELLMKFPSSAESGTFKQKFGYHPNTLSRFNVQILHQDALTFTPPSEPYKLVANIPYYITSPILNHFLREQPESERPTSFTLLVQKEVAEKIVGAKGQPKTNEKKSAIKHSVLSLQVHLFGTPKIVAVVPASHFTPAPKVDSAILHIERRPPLLPDADLEDFFKLLHMGFSHPRKKLIRNLCGLGWLKLDDLQKIFTHLELDENLRAEDLTLEAWKKLYAATSERR